MFEQDSDYNQFINRMIKDEKNVKGPIFSSSKLLPASATVAGNVVKMLLKYNCNQMGSSLCGEEFWFYTVLNQLDSPIIHVVSQFPLEACNIPFGFLYDPTQQRPVDPQSETVRCKHCRAYVNKFCNVTDSSWRCIFCKKGK